MLPSIAVSANELPERAASHAYPIDAWHGVIGVPEVLNVHHDGVLPGPQQRIRALNEAEEDATVSGHVAEAVGTGGVKLLDGADEL